MQKAESTIILGLGNILCADDGFGCHVAQMLQENFAWPENCAVVDGGSQGQILYGIVSSAEKLLLLDATDFGQRPGTVYLRRDAEIPAWLGSCKLSAHQGSFAEVIALASLRSELPGKMTLIGLQPELIEFGQPMSPTAQDSISAAVDLALEELQLWDIRPTAASGKPDAINAELRGVFCPRIRA